MTVPVFPSSVKSGNVPGGKNVNPGRGGRLSGEGGVVGNGGKTVNATGIIELMPTKLISTAEGR
jgi:hypothetical protein